MFFELLHCVYNFMAIKNKRALFYKDERFLNLRMFLDLISLFHLRPKKGSGITNHL